MLLVFIRNILIRPSELTPGRLFIDSSCHLISPYFLFACSSCLIHIPSPPPWSLRLSPQTLSLVSEDAQTDSLAHVHVCQNAREGTSVDNTGN